VRRRFAQVKYRCKTGIAPLQQLAPLVLRTLSEDSGKLRLQSRPFGRVVEFCGQLRIEAGFLQQQPQELRLERTDGNVPAVAGRINAVVRCRTVEEVAASFRIPMTGG